MGPRVSAWLREGIEELKRSGWVVVRSVDCIVFERADADEHTFRIPMPLPDDALGNERHRQDLLLRVRAFAPA